MSSPINQYQQVSLQANITNANAYKVVQALLNNILDKIAKAKFCIAENKIADKGLNISFAITTLDALQSSLDKEKGGEIAENLFNLYDYIGDRLIAANLENDVKMLDERYQC